MVIKGFTINDETIAEIGKFAILWNNFERQYCGNMCTPRTIKNRISNITINDEKQLELSNVFNNRRKYYGQSVADYVQNSLHPGSARRSNADEMQYMEEFLNQQGDNIYAGCLLAIQRIRNNMMHGLKCIGDLDNQIELFKAVNGVLESVSRR